MLRSASGSEEELSLDDSDTAEECDENYCACYGENYKVSKRPTILLNAFYVPGGFMSCVQSLKILTNKIININWFYVVILCFVSYLPVVVQLSQIGARNIPIFFHIYIVLLGLQLLFN